MHGGRTVEAGAALGDRVKTDSRDARHLARLLHLGEIVCVAVASVEQEAVRDLVRAREDCRGDLMSSRHRLSKLLLRRGIVYSGGEAWTAKTGSGYAVNVSIPRDCSWPTMPRSTPCWQRRIAVTAWIAQSPTWLPTHCSPR